MSTDSQAGNPTRTAQAAAPVAGWYNTEQWRQEQNRRFFEYARIESIRGSSVTSNAPTSQTQQHTPAVASQLTTSAALRPRPPVASATTQQPSGSEKGQQQQSSAMLVSPTVPVSANLQAVFGTPIVTALAPARQLTMPDLAVRTRVEVTPVAQPVTRTQGLPTPTTTQTKASTHEDPVVIILRSVHLARTPEERHSLMEYAMKLVAERK